MSYSAAEKQRVFLACKPIFAGPQAGLRKLKIIKKRIADHENLIRPMLPGFNLKRTAGIAKDLLQREVFQLDMKARVEFPDLYVSSPAKEVQHDAFEDEAARSVAEKLNDIASTYERDEAQDTQETIPAPMPAAAQQPPPVADVGAHATISPGNISSTDAAPTPLMIFCTATEKTLTPEPQATSPYPSLYPLYFPYHAQHSILCTVQKTLEESCFDFARKWLPSELEDRGWDCAMAVELTKWTNFLPRWSSRLPDGSLQLQAADLGALMSVIRKIRHTAVHRLPTTARGIASFVASATKLVEALGDTPRLSQLEELHADIQEKIKIMDLTKNALEDQLSRDLRAIQLRREELDRQEEFLRLQTVRNDRENKALMGVLVEEYIEGPFHRRIVDDSGFATADEGDDD
ncbi:uncharacterized protein BDW47DRAFT_133937 [Aspergillus candidus]|uniref:Ubiquinol-cytochrome-c reductase cytochrome c1 n=1 Tax=Aspergillus candidus TaxID=41067 RepID=A0A2I2F2P3_ASPCN|nr:hypothetical protein BDW47DRAFT_133937 [Aspergillus candidus]PLB34915.1 hypothetical protein BDW47DRAFT_133937 [Aspergillus candidus]